MGWSTSEPWSPTMLPNRSADRAHLPLASRAAGMIGFRAIRNRGTVGGSIAHADPAAEWPALLSRSTVM